MIAEGIIKGQPFGIRHIKVDQDGFVALSEADIHKIADAVLDKIQCLLQK